MSTYHYRALDGSIDIAARNLSADAMTAGDLETDSFTVDSFESVATKGLHLQWGRDAAGKGFILNQKDVGSGGVVIGESTTGNAVTQSAFFQTGVTEIYGTLLSTRTDTGELNIGRFFQPNLLDDTRTFFNLGKSLVPEGSGFISYSNITTPIAGGKLGFGIWGSNEVLRVQTDQVAVMSGLLVEGRTPVAGTILQGSHLQWNRGLAGQTWLLNQKGAGSSGVIIGEISAGDVVTNTAEFYDNKTQIPTGQFEVTGQTSEALPTAISTFMRNDVGGDVNIGLIADTAKAGFVDFYVVGNAVPQGRILYNHSDNSLGFQVSAVERLKLEADKISSSTGQVQITGQSAAPGPVVQSVQTICDVAGNAAISLMGEDNTKFSFIDFGYVGTPSASRILYNPATDTLDVNSPFRFSPKTDPFAYSEGSWTPQFKYVSSSGTRNPNAVINYSIQYGHYVRIGKQVTVYYNLVFTSTGDDRWVTTEDIFAVGNLPFTFRRTADASKMKLSAPAGSEVPNGFAGMLPAPSVPTYPPGRVVGLYEVGEVVPLYFNAIVGISKGNWTSDGLTMILLGGVLVEIPTILSYSGFGQTWNLHYIDAVAAIPMEFSGTLTYYTDEPY